MGVLIVAGVVVIAVTIVRRMGGPTPHVSAAMLAEPSGTTITSVAALPDGDLALLLRGGGPDRIVRLDRRSGRLVPLVELAPAR